jgi:uncharacterized membrane protein YgdD (TMEM256/DUF423 family)
MSQYRGPLVFNSEDNIMRLWICAAAVNGFLAVALGAHAAHSLKGRVPDEYIGWIETGVTYGLAHGLALLGVALLAAGGRGSQRALWIAGWCFLLGTVLFSGVLYAMGMTGWRALGWVVPLGGVLFLIGWGALFVFGLGLGFLMIRRPPRSTQLETP